jgi:hypothetical protein
MQVWRQRFGGALTCCGVGADGSLLIPLGFVIGTFGGTVATLELSSKPRRCFRNRRSATVLLHPDIQLNDLQTSQGQLLNNFISGAAGGFVGTVLNTPYVRPFTLLCCDANSLLSLLPVSTSAAELIEYTVAVLAHTLHTGSQVSHPGSRESTRCCPEIQLDIPCVCLFSVKITCHGGYLAPVRLITIFREEGPIALYKGFVPKVLRLAPGGGVLLLVVEFTLGVFRKGTSLSSGFVMSTLLMTSLLSDGPTICLR